MLIVLLTNLAILAIALHLKARYTKDVRFSTNNLSIILACVRSY